LPDSAEFKLCQSGGIDIWGTRVHFFSPKGFQVASFKCGGYLKNAVARRLSVATVVALQAALYGGFDGSAVLFVVFACSLAVEEGASFGFAHQTFAAALLKLFHSGEEGVFIAFVLGGGAVAGKGVDGDLETIFQVAQALLFAGLDGLGLGKGGEEGGSKEG